MLNAVWMGIVIASLLFSMIRGTYGETVQGGIESAQEAVKLMLTLLAVMSFFNGMMNIAKKGGITDWVAKRMSGLLRLIFRELPRGHESFGAMSMNITANLLGMGNAATPLGINAMKSLNKLNLDPGSATNSMCLFAVMNTASIQLIPSSIIAIRMTYGSAAPFSIVVPTWISSTCGLLAALTAAKYFEKKDGQHGIR